MTMVLHFSVSEEKKKCLFTEKMCSFDFHVQYKIYKLGKVICKIFYCIACLLVRKRVDLNPGLDFLTSPSRKSGNHSGVEIR